MSIAHEIIRKRPVFSRLLFLNKRVRYRLACLDTGLPPNIRIGQNAWGTLIIHNRQSGKFSPFRPRKRQTNHFRYVFIRGDFHITFNSFRGQIGVRPCEGLLGHNDFSISKVKFVTKLLCVKRYKQPGQTFPVN